MVPPAAAAAAGVAGHTPRPRPRLDPDLLPHRPFIPTPTKQEEEVAAAAAQAAPAAPAADAGDDPASALLVRRIASLERRLLGTEGGGLGRSLPPLPRQSAPRPFGGRAAAAEPGEPGEGGGGNGNGNGNGNGCGCGCGHSYGCGCGYGYGCGFGCGYSYGNG